MLAPKLTKLMNSSAVKNSLPIVLIDALSPRGTNLTPNPVSSVSFALRAQTGQRTFLQNKCTPFRSMVCWKNLDSLISSFQR